MKNKALVVGFVILAILLLPYRLAEMAKSRQAMLRILNILGEIATSLLQLPELLIAMLVGLAILAFVARWLATYLKGRTR